MSIRGDKDTGFLEVTVPLHSLKPPGA
jgi:hypothetical protein